MFWTRDSVDRPGGTSPAQGRHREPRSRRPDADHGHVRQLSAKIVTEMPVTPLGKIPKFVLHEPLAQEVGARLFERA